MEKITTIVFLVLGLAAWVSYAQVSGPPVLDPNEWWGPEELRSSCSNDTSIRKVKVKFYPEMVHDLKSRLRRHFKKNSRTNFAPVKDAKFNYGFSTTQLDSWLTYWIEDYDFKQREDYFNQYQHYKTMIQGLDIHFLWIKPQVPEGMVKVPLMLLHGWPGSFREFYKAIPLLTQPREGYNFVFELIIPSLPGFGYSDAPVRSGMGNAYIGVVLKNLMNRLGYKKFYLQGGDWGSLISSTMATMYQDDILGYISNMMFVLNTCTEVTTLAGAAGVAAAAPDRLSPMTIIIEESGYTLLQSTKPDTVGIALADSPAGLMAWIAEKFSSWTRIAHRELEDGGLGFRFTKDEILDNVMVYWSSNCITSSMRLDAENFSYKYRALGIDGYSSKVPAWGIKAKHEIFAQPPNPLKYPNLLGYTELDDGGHFLAFELPELFSQTVFNAADKIIEYNRKIKTEL